MRYNLNQKVRVKLTDHGKECLRKNHEQLRRDIPTISRDPALPKEDENGWSEWQLWCLMRDLGPHICMGMHPPFETTIELIEPEAQ